MSLAGSLTAAEVISVAAAGTSPQPVSVRVIPIEVLRDQAHLIPMGALELRGIGLREASIVRRGGNVGWGAPPYDFQPMPAEQQRKVLAQADFELAVEEARRVVSPDAPSRLSCLWVADDTLAGRNYVHELVGHEAFVLSVQLRDVLRIARLDVRWLRRAFAEMGPEDYEGYWSGQAQGTDPPWETLVYGT